jgi:formamidopyrimidine-DNA glycosylase
LGQDLTVPELPDVEGFRRYLARRAAGKRIEGVDVLDRDLLRNATPEALNRALKGRSFERPARHGKWLIAGAGGPEVLMHFGMTGLLHFSRDPGDRHVHDRIVFRFDDGSELRYRNMRRFGGMWLASDSTEREAVTGPLGPDAPDVDRDSFRELLAHRRGAIKPALMDQTLIAGLGNLLVDEILWRARIAPTRPVARMRPRDIDRVHDIMSAVLREANRHARVPGLEGWLTGVRDSRDPRCPRCGTRLRRGQVGGRTTVWCPRDQRS